MPQPLALTKATCWPGVTANETPSSWRRTPSWEKETSSNVISPAGGPTTTPGVRADGGGRLGKQRLDPLDAAGGGEEHGQRAGEAAQRGGQAEQDRVERDERADAQLAVERLDRACRADPELEGEEGEVRRALGQVAEDGEAAVRPVEHVGLPRNAVACACACPYAATTRSRPACSVTSAVRSASAVRTAEEATVARRPSRRGPTSSSGRQTIVARARSGAIEHTTAV